MADISSSIRIEDGFTEPLKNLAKASWNVETAVTAVTKSLVNQEDEIDNISDKLKKLGGAFVIRGIAQTLSNFNNLYSAVKNLSKGISFAVSNTSIVMKSNLHALEERLRAFGNVSVDTYKKYKAFRELGVGYRIAKLSKYGRQVETPFGSMWREGYINDPAAVNGKKMIYTSAERGAVWFFQNRMKEASKKFRSFLNPFKTEGIHSSMTLKNDFTEPLKNFSKDMSNIFKNTLKDTFKGVVSNLSLKFIGDVSMAAFHKMKNSYINGFNALMESVGKSIDEINIADKLNAQFGEAGDIAKKRSYELANEIGESATMIAELSMKAGQEGIGTEHFERMLKLADKVGKLRQGETTESAANTLMSNIKSGHDASSIAQLFGGGQKMERQLIRAGYERALNRGNLDKALDIAEKIAEQAGLTDENYNKATNNLSQNYKKIMNTIDNVKKRLAETFNRSFAPSVERIKKFLESNTFKNITNVADWLMDKLGKFLNWFIEGAIDNIHVIGILLGIGIVSKTAYLFRIVNGIIFGISKAPSFIAGVAKFVTGIGAKLIAMKGPIGFISRKVALYGGKLIAIIKAQALLIKQKGIMAIKDAAMAKLKIAGPWIAAGAAVAGITYGIYKLTGATKSFAGWLKGVVSAGLKGAENVFTNIFTFFDRIVDYIKALPELAKAAFEDIGRDVDRWIQDVTGFRVTEIIEEENKSRVDEILERIKSNQLKYIDVTDGMTEAYENETITVVEWLKKIFNQGEEQINEQSGIKTNSDLLVKYNEQEEELAWLKAFSNKQIMSGYNYMTSNNSNVVNLNNPSPVLQAEISRRSLKSIPNRRSKLKV